MPDTTPTTQATRGALRNFWHKLGSPRWFYGIAGLWAPWFGAAAVVLLVTGTVWGLAFAPADYQQGNSFRIFYVHVPTAIISQSVYVAMGVAGVILLVWRMKLADVAIGAMVRFGMWMTALALLSGAAWGKPTWGTWWAWDARIVSTLILLFLYIALYALREAIPGRDAAGRASALLAIVGVINIPVIKYSVEWWITLHQGATFTLTSAPKMPAEMYLPGLVNVLGLYCWFASHTLNRMRNEILRREQDTQWVRELIAGSVRK